MTPDRTKNEPELTDQDVKEYYDHAYFVKGRSYARSL